jgi:hypothetical protein
VTFDLAHALFVACMIGGVASLVVAVCLGVAVIDSWRDRKARAIIGLIALAVGVILCALGGGIGS